MLNVFLYVSISLIPFERFKNNRSPNSLPSSCYKLQKLVSVALQNYLFLPVIRL